jgi:hypothetical protein
MTLSLSLALDSSLVRDQLAEVTVDVLTTFEVN